MYHGRLFFLFSLKEKFNFKVLKRDTKDIPLSLFEEYYLKELIDFNARDQIEWNLSERMDIITIYKYVKLEQMKRFKYFNTYDVIKKFQIFLSTHTQLKFIDIDYPDNYYV